MPRESVFADSNICRNVSISADACSGTAVQSTKSALANVANEQVKQTDANKIRKHQGKEGSNAVAMNMVRPEIKDKNQIAQYFDRG